jgi:hypothetical protein
MTDKKIPTLAEIEQWVEAKATSYHNATSFQKGLLRFMRGDRPFQIISASELIAQRARVTVRERIADELETAAHILRRNLKGERDDSAAWRIADAGLQLRNKIERSGMTDVEGVDTPTGRGALLPKAIKPKGYK